MGKFIKYSIFGAAFIIVGLLVGFKIKDSVPVGAMVNIDRGLEKLQRTLMFIERNYVEEPDHQKLIDDAIQGIMKGLDPHSFYIPASEMKQMEEQMEGSFDGIGVQFNVLEDTIYVETPLKGGPSEQLGIQSGDRIIRVDGENVAGIGITNTEVMRRLKGPQGTQVEVTILRRGVPEPVEYTITRDEIPINSVEYAYMIDEAQKVGYIQVTRFAKTTYDEFGQALDQLLDAGMERLILDLRSNPGGYMSRAYKMADELLEAKKLIVSTDGRIPQSSQSYYATSSLSDFEQGPVVVLIDYGSASASEIVAGALQDHDRALVVGVRSFGKGLVQIEEKFRDNSAIRIVISKYYTPSGRCIQKPYDKTEEAYENEIKERFESGEVYDPSKVTFPDSLKFKTASGRVVYGGGGIFPDVFVPSDTTQNSAYLLELRLKNLFRRFSFEYVDERPALTEQYADPTTFVRDFEVSPDMMRQFRSFVEKQGVPYDAKGFKTSEELIRNRIKAFIGRRMFNEEGFYPIWHQADNVLQRAIGLMPVAARLEETGQVKLP
jgi:carboxyl-terminal processing protease